MSEPNSLPCLVVQFRIELTLVQIIPTDEEVVEHQSKKHR